MATQGEININFGSATNKWTVDGSVDVTGQAAILATSKAEAFLMAGPVTADHSEDEYVVEDFRQPICTVPTAGVGFTIYLRSNTPVYGLYTVQWVWN